MKKTILVIGGAGYIGSHMVKRLLSTQHHTIILDNLSTGNKSAILGGEFVQGDFSDPDLLDQIFTGHRIDGIFHFASSIEVGESIRNPGKYYRNNTFKSLTLLEKMVEHGVKHLVFSSTAAVYGMPETTPINETHSTNPINPYGNSKLCVERMLSDYQQAHGLNYVALRYFNAAGADPSGAIGEQHDPETHLIPLTIRSAISGDPRLKVFGDDYDTKDGTCIRDYVHVNDLTDAHLLALEHLWDGGQSHAINLGNGQGFSVREVLESVRNVTGNEVAYDISKRRAGDPPSLVADASKARKILNWTPKYTDLSVIIEHALRWEETKKNTSAPQNKNHKASSNREKNSE